MVDGETTQRTDASGSASMLEKLRRIRLFYVAIDLMKYPSVMAMKAMEAAPLTQRF